MTFLLLIFYVYSGLYFLNSKNFFYTSIKSVDQTKEESEILFLVIFLAFFFIYLALFLKFMKTPFQQENKINPESSDNGSKFQNAQEFNIVSRTNLMKEDSKNLTPPINCTSFSKEDPQCMIGTNTNGRDNINLEFTSQKSISHKKTLSEIRLLKEP